MTLSDRSLSMLKPSTLMTLAMALACVISPVEAAVSCSSTSPQCCWVVRIWQLMGQTTSVSSTSSTACCYYIGSKTKTSGIPGVSCTSTGNVTELNWWMTGLSGPIPADIGNLVNLNYL